MLRRLRITNYALIDHLEIEFKPGFTVITGETGAGKSILLGALGLVLGSRADTGVLHDKDVKCQVEATFDVSALGLQSFFRENDVDYEAECILTREISSAGKSRAFINDTPVNLMLMKALGEFLVDIHSQHDALHLADSAFQLRITDGLANNESQLREYVTVYQKWQQVRSELEQLKMLASESEIEVEMIRFQLDELVKLKLSAGEFEQLQQQAETLSHAEEIRAALYAANEALNRGESNAVQLLRDAGWQLAKAGRYVPTVNSLNDRLEALLIELKDIARESESTELKVNVEPDELERILTRISVIRQLMMKHRVSTADDLLTVRKQLEMRLEKIENKDLSIEQLQRLLTQTQKKLEEKAEALSLTRKKALPEMERAIRLLLTQLGMPNARFEALLEKLPTYGNTGFDKLTFLFTANKGGRPDDIARVASGGELSRLMLAIKSLSSGKKNIPTIIFDEIDTGVSGEIAARVGRIMASMALQTQLIAITHLPQIAGKAQQHLLVYKRDDEKRTRSLIIQLNEQQRIEEIARMLSDDVITPAARNAAKELMGGF